MNWWSNYRSSSTVIKTYSKSTGESFATESEILALMEGLMQAKGLGLSNLMVGGQILLVSFHR